METVTAIPLAAIVSLARPTSAPPDRLEQLAGQIALAVTLAPVASLPFVGAAAAEVTALALVAIARTESLHFDERVLDCRITGDGGRSVSAFQLMRGPNWQGHAREELCPSSALAAQLALDVLAGNAARCNGTGPAGWFRGYASGSCAVRSDVATWQCQTWERLAKRAGLVGALCEGPRRPVRWAAPERTAAQP